MGSCFILEIQELTSCSQSNFWTAAGWVESRMDLKRTVVYLTEEQMGSFASLQNLKPTSTEMRNNRVPGKQ